MKDKIAAEVIKKLNEASSWVVLCHESPDGDTVGCGLALCLLASRLGKSSRIMGKDHMPYRYSFLPMSESYETVLQLAPEDAEGALVICVDTSTVDRSVPGLAEILRTSDTVGIDHHGDNKAYCGINMIDAEASSTAEVVLDLMLSAGWGVTKDEAICLYTALTTDNGNFRFSSTTARSHRCASQLIAAGVDPSYIDDCVNENMSVEIIRLWGLALSRTELFSEGKCALFWLNHSDLKAAEADASVVDGLVNMLLRVIGVKVAILIVETGSGSKASIRTKDSYSARELAEVFGGGGHVHAAGAKISGNFSEALKKIRIEAERYVSNRTSPS